MASWSQLLAKTQEMKSAGTESLYERTVIYKQIFDDPAFRKHCDKNKTDMAIILDKEVDDFTILGQVVFDGRSQAKSAIMLMFQVLERFPEKHQWTNVAVLVNTVVNEAEEKKKAAAGPQIKRPKIQTVPKREHQRITTEQRQKIEKVKAEAESAKKQVVVVQQKADAEIAKVSKVAEEAKKTAAETLSVAQKKDQEIELLRLRVHDLEIALAVEQEEKKSVRRWYEGKCRDYNAYKTQIEAIEDVFASDVSPEEGWNQIAEILNLNTPCT